MCECITHVFHTREETSRDQMIKQSTDRASKHGDTARSSLNKKLMLLHTLPDASNCAVKIADVGLEPDDHISMILYKWVYYIGEM